jgi:hypothetical protein
VKNSRTEIILFSIADVRFLSVLRDNGDPWESVILLNCSGFSRRGEEGSKDVNGVSDRNENCLDTLRGRDFGTSGCGKTFTR